LIGQSVEVTLHTAFVDARIRRHEFITVEHLLLHLCDEPETKKVLEALSVDIGELKRNLAELIQERTPLVPKDKEVDTQPTLGFQRVVQRAILHVQSSGHKLVEGPHLLVAVFGESESHAVYYLQKAGVDRLAVVNYLASGKTPQKEDAKAPEERLKQEIRKFSTRDSTRPRSRKSADVIKKELPAKVFISYSHVDVACLKRLLVHLKPLERQKAIVAWSDQNIRAGDKWKEKIEASLDEAAIAILLVSADFLASEFIVDNELPPLLTRAESQGVRIIQVILKPCGFNRNVILSSFQALNDPKDPLLGMDHIAQEGLYNRIADEITEEITLRQKSGSRSGRAKANAKAN
jgi:hypothetical protein